MYLGSLGAYVDVWIWVDLGVYVDVCGVPGWIWVYRVYVCMYAYVGVSLWVPPQPQTNTLAQGQLTP